MDFDEEESFFGGIKKKEAEAELEEMEAMHCDELEMMDDFSISPPDFNEITNQNKNKTKASGIGNKTARQTVVIDISDDEDSTNPPSRTNPPSKTDSGRNQRNPIQSNPSLSVTAPVVKLDSHQSKSKQVSSSCLEAHFKSSDVVNFQDLEESCIDVEKPFSEVEELPNAAAMSRELGPIVPGIGLPQSDSTHGTGSSSTECSCDDDTPLVLHPSNVSDQPFLRPDASSGTRLSKGCAGGPLVMSGPPQRNCFDELLPSSPRAHGAESTCTTNKQSHHVIAKKQRFFFNDVLKIHISDPNEAVRICKEGYIEGRAISIKKFSVIEKKKVKVPYFLTTLEFSDNVGRQDVQVSSKLCERFLQMSAEVYINKREEHIKATNLDKKEGSNDYKKKIAVKFGLFSGKYLVEFVDNEFILQDYVRNEELDG